MNTWWYQEQEYRLSHSEKITTQMCVVNKITWDNNK
jgi:hypothetical protein